MPGGNRGRDAASNSGTPAPQPSDPDRREARESVAEPSLGERIVYECGGCDHQADAVCRYDETLRKSRWFVGSAFTTRCPKGRECPGRHCAWLAELGIEVTPSQLLDDPRPALTAAGATKRAQPAEVPPLPSRGSVGGWAARVWTADGTRGREYLGGRGISDEVMRQHEVGWDGERRRLTFPMFNAAGDLVGFKTRLPRDGAQMRCWPGKDRAWPLYPDVPHGADWVLLLAGELDALCGRSHALPAVSVTPGAGTWRDAWTDELRGLRVVVAFDNNEGELAERRVTELRASGISASRLDLSTLGLTAPKGDLSDYLNSGGDRNRLKPRGWRLA